MLSKRNKLLLSAVLLLILTVACEISLGPKGPSDEEISVQLTLQSIQQTQTAAAQPPAQPEEEDTAEASDDEGDDDDQSSDEDDDDDCYMSRFVSETIADGTVYQKGDTFTKTWTVRNAGTCTWNTDFRFVFEEGDQMDGPSSIKLTQSVDPGETYTFSVDLTAPDTDGDYTGVWRIKSDDGYNLGKYWVKITVGAGSPSGPFAVTSVSYYMPHTTIDMSCPAMYRSASARRSPSTKRGVVSFKWNDSLGCPGCVTKSINFTEAGRRSSSTP